MPTEYRIDFSIDYFANSPEEACRLAWDLLTRADSWKPIGIVTDPAGRKVQVDLQAEEQTEIGAGDIPRANEERRNHDRPSY